MLVTLVGSLVYKLYLDATYYYYTGGIANSLLVGYVEKKKTAPQV
jgi:hypothetical protein